MHQNQWMDQAISLALENVLNSHGGPFGAVIIRDGQVVGTGRNEVTTNNDPTAHAEVQAIRDACRNLNTFQLTDCELYTSCEPCPMCLGAIYWARLHKVYFSGTKEEAAQAGFDDHFIYEQIEQPFESRSIPFERVQPEKGKEPFRAWTSSQSRIHY
ncbi:nucleoside deaminase [Brevibacillus invocatus]|uniref:Nucleoside deaminase n=1 Tax=Brevibacillus invocatus TaxID=173959 RepID=A0A3M8CFD9_9BACL|nr:nucleoside deaminase [Brevibacillus invocatus]RNB74117.1 nucleoside deaminase [Brevibacillus invocatus]